MVVVRLASTVKGGNTTAAKRQQLRFIGSASTVGERPLLSGELSIIGMGAEGEGQSASTLVARARVWVCVFCLHIYDLFCNLTVRP